ncbi:peptide chain release factor 1 [Synoicihabitans lomoniglobus]|uniref:Peptide chain release factor 1 n=1 Tax=Synoicihabitans lomoniglobus TaxID=2909285 RepID=A0AAF0CQJ3_9BACT|nr:peptide chain release factor 1 [Opitutaceae bacterium LMO-M01]WED66235.1 peptide chain release factor 1 [Opitutaceae bacterium LMO-M01]
MSDLPDITPFRRRLDELDAQMSDPNLFADPRRAATVSRDQQRMARLVADYDKITVLDRQIEEARGMLKDDQADPDLRELAEMELPENEAAREQLQRDVLVAMIPPEPTDSRNTVLEIRAGTGGDEAALFGGELYRAYSRFADTQGWKVQPMSSSEAERGGYKEVIALITGDEVYRQLKFESGVHRVQRVPVTEANGRIHTSTVTVAVMPEAQEVDIEIDPQDLEISVTRASGPGGQGVNTTDSAVQILHKPTGAIVYCADERSQIKNKAKAMTVLRARLLKIKEDEERAKYAAQRKGQIGTGDRSERIRTYNFPQSRVTDHRIGLTLHSLPQVMEGEFEPLVTALMQEDMAMKLAALSEGQAAMPAWATTGSARQA